ncbi:MAG: WcaF family extracellular polysaccharide biosynthesis acetyltransferase [Hyphomicrobiaceae bacterium]
MKKNLVNLNAYKSSEFQRGRSGFVEGMWCLIQALFIASFVPGSMHRCFLLRLFGAKVGQRVVLKPGLKIKFPWRLQIANDVWIGENVWIDNLTMVTINSNVCVSQGAYLCTGNHNWTSPNFDLITAPITIDDCVWVAARSTVGPGVNVSQGAILTIGSVATDDLEPWTINSGNPAKRVKARRLAKKTLEEAVNSERTENANSQRLE